jgi:integrase
MRKVTYRGRKPSVRWRADRGYWYVTLDKQRRVLAVGKENRDFAEKAFARLLAERDRRHAMPGTVAAAVEDYLSHVSDTKSPKTLENYSFLLNSFLSYENNATMQMAEFRKSDVERFTAAMKHNWSQTTRHNCVETIRTFLKWFEEENAGLTPFARKSLNKIGRAKRRHNQFGITTREQFDTIIAAVKSKHFRDFLTYCFATGCRPGEAAKIQRKHVDKEFVVTFQPEECSSKKTGGVGECRIIYAEQIGLEVLKRLCDGKGPDDYIFVNKNNTTWTKGSMYEHFAIIKRKTGLPVYPYSTRVGFISRKLEEKMPINIIASLVGHRDTTIISKHYDVFSKRRDVLQQALATSAD